MKSTRILLVEDDSDIAEAVSMLLQIEGFEVDVHSKGKDILESNFKPPDLFLIDGNLPDCTGVQLCEYLRSQEAFSKIPLIFLSANIVLAAEVKSRNLAVTVDKPFERQRLIQAIDLILEVHQK